MNSTAVFLDKDGTLLDDVPYNVDPARMRFAPGARAALTLLAARRVALIVVSNQSGVALGRFAPDALDAVAARLRAMFAECGATLAGAYWCPHHPRGSVAAYARACGCRKPAPGMLLQAAREHGLDLARSWFVGDILDDVEAGNRAGCRTVLLDNGHETEWLPGALRVPTARAADLHGAARLIAAHDGGAPAGAGSADAEAAR
ncbi:D-glycero-alpha-D-manno-heptose-1,7-bisphosphate 7-phosphatase [Burkholderia glumae]|uniref:D,D-heptose 1,7-bisphosphate phosphatase n=1 Tax=Burkholderia glumae TaxID=337 RepID=A0AAP9Y4C4_BURGL|nr:HAD-IIIA family hydrolase [Burkholderia glumae]ACR28649.1 Hydrolase, HAD-superfamily, subfamily IIIA [Burkholderia glumae BGR1]AJY67077.1 HAD hydrolase, family IIIA domain protein [Burkholderia glumae LMG 2196 = ATCC 33617]KHJ63317.1 HAD family hydrolase [Burkholderia glumae]MCM2480325.1 HAD-IIIA family hydrolase [Burkholderia glumae]MCM2493035.1 HAD-IIIA family hydrolase [Burkholderia glumae]